MAIDIFNPPQGGPLGPGIPYNVRDLAVPTVTPPAHWEIAAWDLQLANTPIARHIHPIEGSVVNQAALGVFGTNANQFLALPAGRTLTLDGAPVEFRARLIANGGAQVVEELAQPMVWDTSYAWTVPSITQGGFTADDRLNLSNVLSAVRLVLPAALPGAAQLVMSAIDLVRGPPRSLLRTFGSLLLEGRGTIPVVPEGALFTFGGTWSWFTIPAGWGRQDGVLTTYNNRVLQLQVLREGADDSLYNDLVVEENQEGGFVQWQVPTPSEIHYDLAPGWVALWRWLV